jgi:hypothetical protein
MQCKCGHSKSWHFEDYRACTHYGKYAKPDCFCEKFEEKNCPYCAELLHYAWQCHRFGQCPHMKLKEKKKMLKYHNCDSCGVKGIAKYYADCCKEWLCKYCEVNTHIEKHLREESG